MPETIIDLYPFLEVKNATDPLGRIAVSYSWVPEEHLRRLQAYTVLAAYEANLANKVRQVAETTLHEYGDVKFVCRTLSMALLGDETRIVAPLEKEIESFFTEWAADEIFFAKLSANEYKGSNLGDCVYRLNWSGPKKRVEITTFDPGFWFPFNLGLKNERQVLAWEEKDPTTKQTIIYKEEYSIGGSASGGGGKSNNAFLTAGYYQKSERPSLDDLKLVRYAENSEGKRLNNFDLGIEFIPLVYIPNIFVEGWDFGESDVTGSLRIFDQVQNTYNDLASNTRLMGNVQMWMKRETFEKMPINDKGQVTIETGPGKIIPGEAGIVDNSTINEALMKYLGVLDDRLLRNTFIGAIGAGKLNTGSGDRTTGILMMKGSPLERFISVKRLMRYAKYNKMLKFIGKFELAHGSKETKKLFAKDRIRAARILFGNIMPVDQTALITNIQKIANRLDNADLKDNLKEAGLIVNNDVKDPVIKQPVAQPKG